MEYNNWMIPGLRDILKERGVRDYSRKRKAELIEMLWASEPPTMRPSAWKPVRPLTWEPKRPKRTRPPHPKRPPPTQKPGGPPPPTKGIIGPK